MRAFALAFMALLLAASGVTASGDEETWSPALDIPASALQLVERAFSASPEAQALERGLQRAMSRHRARRGEFETSTGLRANIEGRRDGSSSGKGFGASVQWSVRQPLGRSEIVFSVGPGVAQRWNRREMEAAPVVGLSARHPFGQGPDVRRDRIDFELAEAMHRHRMEKNRLLRDVVDAYGQAAVAEATLDVAAARLEVAEAELEAVMARSRQGDAPTLALHEAQQRHAEALDEWEMARLAVDEARRGLALLVDGQLYSSGAASTIFTGGSGADPSVVTDGGGAAAGQGEAGEPSEPGHTADPDTMGRIYLDVDDPVAARVDAWVALAQSERMERVLAEEAVRLAEAELEGARRRRGWTGEWAARVTYPDPDSFPGDAERKAAWRVGAQFSLPLSDPGGPEQVLEAELALEEAIAARDAVDRTIDAEVTAAFYQAERAMRRLERAKGQAEQAAWLADVAAANVAAGLESEQAVLEAKLVQSQAKRSVVEARFDLIHHVIALWQATGRDITW